MTDFRDPWLVQRLERPTGPSIFGKDNPFAFGGGLRNGGLSGEAMDLLRPIFRFAYMGAAEFEFGAVPKALDYLARHGAQLGSFTVSIPLKDVPKNWRDKGPQDIPGDGTVYVLARSDEADLVAESIRRMARRESRTKERVGLESALRPHNEWDRETVGWLALDPAFLFFTDAPSWQATCALFGVEVLDAA
jgi:hypothetical protein